MALDLDHDGPTANDLAAIETELPLIEAEIALVDAEIHVLTAPHGPSQLDWRRLRRAEHRVIHETIQWLAVHQRPADRAA
jgi:hypothetical protein